MKLEKPIYRKLRVFAYDPATTVKLDQAMVNEVTLKIPWEEKLKPGPAGEYVAVVDQDDQGVMLHEPVDLDDPLVLAENGFPPSDGNPFFRQQMVYAVAMRTIAAFEKALGRKAQWPLHNQKYLSSIKIYPHYFNTANAYYDPNQEALCFGYFISGDHTRYPGMVVFSCLSQDVIAHELAHVLLDGMHSHLKVPTNPDVFAFHEGFADIVALLQQFSLPDALRHQLAINRGELIGPNTPLGVIAQQFSEALGMPSGLHGVLGEIGEDGIWRKKAPDPQEYPRALESHQRGWILVRAVFDALDMVYRARVADLRRLATEGSGVLKEGELHPDLVNRLAIEASKTAQVVLEMCVRALDYCPAVDITFSDYLRAIITADFDLYPSDPLCYRVAFLETFRQYGIFPADVGTLSIEGLLWPKPKSEPEESVVRDFILRELAVKYTSWNLPEKREELFTLMRDKAQLLGNELTARKQSLKGLLGAIDPRKPFEVKSIWPRQHSGVYGQTFSQWVIEIVQNLGQDKKGTARLACCTLLVDAETGLVRYIIQKNSETPVGLRNLKVDGVVKKLESGKSLLKRSNQVTMPKVFERRLRVYAFDPSLSVRLDTVLINEITLRIPWEELHRNIHGQLIDLKKCGIALGYGDSMKFDKSTVRPEYGDPKDLKKLPSVPRGEYLEVIDYDAPSGCFYEPVDLHHPYLLADDGLAPSQSVPQFHQQMVYAVAMRTIRNFESILGRTALWSSQWSEDMEEEGEKKKIKEVFVPRLRLYPHALREANAFYSPEKKALLFGYFQTQYHPQAAPVTVFTCLSQDIIAHEMTHALLDGMHRRLVEASNPDVLAFHEAFADLVAIFQHFSLPEVLENQIAVNRGDLASQSRLGELAQEFGAAFGNRGALRDAIGAVDPQTGEWRRLPPDPQAYLTEMEPHKRGALLVATVFDAFLILYQTRVADLLRIATHGSGVLPAGNIHLDLVRRLSKEAAHCAETILKMCVRATDYLPPVDITFGDYLHAIVTASYELDPVDEEHHRVAFIEAFRRHGILPDEMSTYSQEGLLWEPARAHPEKDQKVVLGVISYWSKTFDSWNISRDREELFNMMIPLRAMLHQSLKEQVEKTGLFSLDPDRPFEVNSLVPSQRVDLGGKAHFQWVIEITQCIGEHLDETAPSAPPDYYFRGGVTLLVDAVTGEVRYMIPKRLNDPERRARQHKFIQEVRSQSLYATYFQDKFENEPFAVLHRF